MTATTTPSITTSPSTVIITIPSAAPSTPSSIAYYPPQGNIVFMIDNSLVTGEELNVRNFFEEKSQSLFRIHYKR